MSQLQKNKKHKKGAGIAMSAIAVSVAAELSKQSFAQEVATQADVLHQLPQVEVPVMEFSAQDVAVQEVVTSTTVSEDAAMAMDAVIDQLMAEPVQMKEETATVTPDFGSETAYDLQAAEDFSGELFAGGVEPMPEPPVVEVVEGGGVPLWPFLLVGAAGVAALVAWAVSDHDHKKKVIIKEVDENNPPDADTDHFEFCDVLQEETMMVWDGEVWGRGKKFDPCDENPYHEYDYHYFFFTKDGYDGKFSIFSGAELILDVLPNDHDGERGPILDILNILDEGTYVGELNQSLQDDFGIQLEIIELALEGREAIKVTLPDMIYGQAQVGPTLEEIAEALRTQGVYYEITDGEDTDWAVAYVSDLPLDSHYYYYEYYGVGAE